MNGIRKWTWAIAVSALVAIAFPALAGKPGQGQPKSYSVEFLLPPTALDGSPNPSYATDVNGNTKLNLPVTVTVFIKNEAPPSTAASNASSLQFTISGLVPVGVNCPRAQCTVDTTTGTVYVSNISQPIQATEIYPVTLTANSCVVIGEATIRDVHVYTGSSFSGQEFTPFASDASFPIQQVLATRTPFGFPTTAPFPAIAVTGITCGTAECGLDVTVPNILGDAPGTSVMRIIRGPDASGSCSTANFDYFVTNNLWSANVSDPLFRRLHASWSAPGISPVFAYELTRASAAIGWQVGWLPKPGTATTITAPVCFPGLSANEPMSAADLPFPAFVGVLSQDLRSNANKIKVDTLGGPLPTVPPGGLPIRIDGEWMLLTSTGSTSWDVTRLASQSGFHPTGATVATTPMPLLSGVSSPYSNNTPAQMCMVWQSTDTLTAWFIDGNDGWILGR